MSTEIPRGPDGRVLRPKPSQLLQDVMDALGPDHPTTRALMAALIERDQGAGVEPRAVSPTFGWHIPVLGDVPNVPYDMQELALDIEGTDTGLRDVRTLLINGWTGSKCNIRRVGHVVSIIFSLTVPATWNRTALGSITGFNGTGNYGVSSLTGGANPGLPDAYPSNISSAVLNIGPPTKPASVAAGNIVTGSMTWLTYDTTWPTSLPGAPILLRDLLDQEAQVQPA